MTENKIMAATLHKEVKDNDYYRYICSLFASSNAREKLLALYAFNFEISKIKDITSEAMTGLIRITWWNEAIDEIYSGKTPRKHEVVEALAETIKSTNIPREYFSRMIEARETDIGLRPIVSMADFQQYINNTAGTLLEASLYILGIDDKKAFEAAGHIGTAYAIIGFMRSLKWNIAKGSVFIPQDMLDKYNIIVEDAIEGKNLQKTKDLAGELCVMVEDNLRQAKLLKSSSLKAMPVYLHSIIAKHFLNLIRKNNYDLFHSDLEGGKLGILFKMFLAARFSR